MVKVFIGEERVNSQRHLGESRAERESRLGLARVVYKKKENGQIENRASILRRAAAGAEE